MKLTTVEGMQSEIFVPITLKPIFTELKKPLSECKVAFITAGGIQRKDQTPFNTSGDFSYRVIPFDTPSDMLMLHTATSTTPISIKMSTPCSRSTVYMNS